MLGEYSKYGTELNDSKERCVAEFRDGWLKREMAGRHCKRKGFESKNIKTNQ